MATNTSKKSAPKKTAAKPKPRPSRAKKQDEPQVASAQGRSRPQDVNKDNAEAEKQQTGPLQPPEDKPEVDDTHHALQVLRDGVHPGTPYGYVHDGESQRDRLGVPYINRAAAKKLEKDGLATIEDDSKIRPVT